MEGANAKSSRKCAMKIVFLHHANVCRGGIERMLCTRANLMVEQNGYEVMMLTYEQNGEPYPYSLSPKVKCIDLGIRLYAAYKSPLFLRYFRKLCLRRQLARAIRSFLDAYQPDIVVCTDKDANELNALSRVRRSECIMIEAHTGMIDHWIQVRRTTNIIRQFIARFDMYRLKRAVSRFDVLIALTEDDANCWKPFVKTEVIPNYYSYHSVCSADVIVEKKRVISVGRLDYQKGQDLLLQAWAIVEAKHPDWQLDILGDGEELDSLNFLVSALHLQNVVIHPSTKDVYSEYSQSDFLVCSSRWESFGLIIIEAMSCGIPVVSFDCDNGPRNIITDGEDGLLAKNGSIVDLADKINQMIENSSERRQMGVHALRNVERFKEEVVFKQYLELYRQYV